MRKIKLTLQYDGTDYAGWQIQPTKMTVQEIVQKTLCQILSEDVKIVGASRTDAGVHALGQVAHFETESDIVPLKLLSALNGILPDGIAVSEVKEAPGDFHANKKAKKKKYLYLIENNPIRSPFLHNRAWHIWSPLNWKEMKKASCCLIGRHDFSAFRGAQSDTKTSVRTIDRIVFRRLSVGAGFFARGGAPIMAIEITGNGFLKYMVRNIVGTLVEVGKGRMAPSDMKKILQSKDRKKAGMTAPARGLYLMNITY